MVEQLFLVDHVVGPVQRLRDLRMAIRGAGQLQATRRLHQARGQRHNARREGGREHQRLIAMLAEMIDVFQIFGKAQIQHAVGLIDDQCFDFRQMDLTALRQIE